VNEGLKIVLGISKMEVNRESGRQMDRAAGPYALDRLAIDSHEAQQLAGTYPSFAIVFVPSEDK
jgi:hypothetical protein